MSNVGYDIRPATTEDRPSILAVLIDAFKQENEAHLVDRLWMDDAIEIEFVAEKGNKIVGYCAFSKVSANPSLPGLLLGMAPVAVCQNEQQKGCGGALVEMGLKKCASKNAVLVVVLGEPEYYGRFGFEPASAHNLSWGAMDAGDAFQTIDLGCVKNKKPHIIDYHPAFSKT